MGVNELSALYEEETGKYSTTNGIGYDIDWARWVAKKLEALEAENRKLRECLNEIRNRKGKSWILKQEKAPPEILKIIDDNFWDLMADKEE